MVIQTLDKAYEVIKKFEENPGRAVYLCRKAGDEEGKTFLITAFASDTLPREQVIFFMELSLRREAEDFEECFLKNEFLYLVFAWRDEEPLLEVLKKETLSAAQRLEVSRSLVEQLVRKNLPDYLLYEALSTKNVGVAGDGAVSFNYFMENNNLLGWELYPEVLKRLSYWLRELFSQELAADGAEDLEVFTQGLENQKYRSYAELYRRYRAVYERMAEKIKDDGLRPDTFLIKQWKRLKRAVKWLKYLLYAAVLIAMLAYLIYSILEPKEGTGSMPLEQIGEIVIEKDKAPEQEP